MPVGVALGVPATKVADGEGLIGGEGVLETVAVGEFVLESLPVIDEVGVTAGVPDNEEPPDAVGELLGVGELVGESEGEGRTTPCTNRGPAYIVPALVTEFQAFVVKTPAAAPVHTLVRERSP